MRARMVKSRAAIGDGGSGMVALDGRTEALVGDMGAGNEVEAGSGKFWWRAEMFWGTGWVVPLTEKCDPCTHLDRDKRSDSCSLSWRQSEVTERGQLGG